MKTLFVLAVGLLALAGCSQKPAEAPATPPPADTATQPVQVAPGAPADANKPLTDGRIDKQAEAGPGSAGGGK